MASAPPETGVNNEADDFERHFNEYATARATGQAVPVEEVTTEEVPEGNAPPADEGAPAPEDQQAETGTSGDNDGAPAPPTSTAPDKWASLPDDVRVELQRIEKERDQALQRAKSSDGRVSALSRKLHTLTSGGAQAPSAEPTEAQKALDEKIKQTREDYPDVAGPLVDLIEAQRQELQQMKAQMGTFSEDRQAAIEEQQRQALAAAHPDYTEIAQRGDFHDWVAAQPVGIQQLAQSVDAREVSTLLTLFKNELGIGGSQEQAKAVEQAATVAATGVKRRQQLEGGRVVSSRPAPAANGPTDGDGFEANFEYYSRRRQERNRR